MRKTLKTLTLWIIPIALSCSRKSKSEFCDAEPQGIAVDGEGNVYLTGYYDSKTINFGGGDLENAGYEDIFLAKFDKDGRYVWSKRFGGTYDDEGYALAVDGERNVYLTGYFVSGTINFGGDDLENAGTWDIFLAKFDKDGRHVWSKRFGGDNWDEGYALAVDGEGNVYLTGYFESSTINFGGGDLERAGTWDVFLANFDKYGSHVWSKRFGEDVADFGSALAVDGEGNVYLTGSFNSSTINFGGGDLENVSGWCKFVLCSDIFLAKFDKDGRHVWSKRFGGTYDDEGLALALDGEGNVYLTGYFVSGTINFGGGDLEKAGGRDIFLAKFDKYGRHVWSKNFRGDWDESHMSPLQRLLALAVDGEGNVYLTGYFESSTINFGGSVLKNASGSCYLSPCRDIFLAKFDKDGKHVWSKRFGGEDWDVGSALAVDGEGNVYLTGYFQSTTINFGGGDLKNAGGREIFLAKFDKDGRHVWSKRFGAD